MKYNYDRKCDYEYLEVRCTIKDCKDINYFGKPKGNSLIVLLYNHKKQNNFSMSKLPLLYFSNWLFNCRK